MITFKTIADVRDDRQVILTLPPEVPVGQQHLTVTVESVPAKADTVRSVLDEIIRNRITPAAGTPDSVEMLREDRNR